MLNCKDGMFPFFFGMGCSSFPHRPKTKPTKMSIIHSFAFIQRTTGKNKHTRNQGRSSHKKKTGRSSMRNKCTKRQEREPEEEVQMDNDLSKQMFIQANEEAHRLERIQYHLLYREQHRKDRNTKKPQQKKVSQARDDLLRTWTEERERTFPVDEIPSMKECIYCLNAFSNCSL